MRAGRRPSPPRDECAFAVDVAKQGVEEAASRGTIGSQCAGLIALGSARNNARLPLSSGLLKPVTDGVTRRSLTLVMADPIPILRVSARSDP